MESVWDYPRPPRLEPCRKHLRVVAGGVVIAETHRSLRVLETSHPPVYYFPPDDVEQSYLRLMPRRSMCEWKGVAHYWDLVVAEQEFPQAAWSYFKTTTAFAEIHEYLAFYSGRVDACYVDDQRVESQPGDFYGGWITGDLIGPFKGSPGTLGW